MESRLVECCLLLFIAVTLSQVTGQQGKVCKYRDDSCSVLGLSCRLSHHSVRPQFTHVSHDGTGKPRELDAYLYRSRNITFLNITWLPPQGSVHRGSSALEGFSVQVSEGSRTDYYQMDLNSANWTTFSTKDENKIRGTTTYDISVTSMPYVHYSDIISQTTSLTIQASDSPLVMPLIVRIKTSGQNVLLNITFGAFPATNTSRLFNNFKLIVSVFDSKDHAQIAREEKNISGRQFTYSELRRICDFQYVIEVFPLDTVNTSCEAVEDKYEKCTTEMHAKISQHGTTNEALQPCQATSPLPESTPNNDDTTEKSSEMYISSTVIATTISTNETTMVTATQESPLAKNGKSASTIAAIIAIGCVVGLVIVTVFFFILYRMKGNLNNNGPQLHEEPAGLNNNINLASEHRPASEDSLQGATGGTHSAVIIFAEDSKAHCAVVEEFTLVLKNIYNIQIFPHSNFTSDLKSDLALHLDFIFIIVSSGLINNFEILSSIENWWNNLNQSCSVTSTCKFNNKNGCNNAQEIIGCNNSLKVPSIVSISYSHSLQSLNFRLPIPVHGSFILSDLRSLDQFLQHHGVSRQEYGAHRVSACSDSQLVQNLIVDTKDPSLDSQSDSSSCSEAIRKINDNFDKKAGITAHHSNLVVQLDDVQVMPNLTSTSSV